MNELRASLCSGPQLGMCYMYPAPGIIERIGPDWDWVWIDGQHGELGYNDILSAVRACDVIMRPAVVRVSGQSPGDIGKALDTVPAAVMVPMVDNADQARTIVQAAKFPPLGSRSYGGPRVSARAGGGTAADLPDRNTDRFGQRRANRSRRGRGYPVLRSGRHAAASRPSHGWRVAGRLLRRCVATGGGGGPRARQDRRQYVRDAFRVGTRRGDGISADRLHGRRDAAGRGVPGQI